MFLKTTNPRKLKRRDFANSWITVSNRYNLFVQTTKANYSRFRSPLGPAVAWPRFWSNCPNCDIIELGPRNVASAKFSSPIYRNES
jgi:hypothetical protein